MMYLLRTARNACLVVVFGLALLATGQVSATGTVQDSCWCAHEIKDESPATPFVVPAPPAGYSWTLLVLKAGAVDIGYGKGVDAPVADPVVGRAYQHSTGKAISYAILCKEQTPTTTTTTTTTTTAPTTTAPTTTAPTTTTTLATTTTQPSATTTTPAPTTTTPGPTTTAVQQQPTTTVVQQLPPASGGPTPSIDPSGQILPATGIGGGSAALTVVALTLIGVGVVMLRLVSKPTR